MKKRSAIVETFDFQEFEKYLKIDRDDLDEEIERQPELYYRVASEEAVARSKLDKLEVEIEHKQAELDRRIRKRALDADESITEGGIKARIRTHKEYVGLAEGVIRLREHVNKLGALKDSFRSRSYMLRDLVELYVSGYYTDSAIRASGGRHKDKKAERIRERMSKKRKERMHN